MPSEYRRSTKLQLVRTQGPLCPLCYQRAVSDLHEIIYIAGVQKGGKYNLTGDFALAIYAPGNTILLCNDCNVIRANSVGVAPMLALKMVLPGVDPLDVVKCARKIATFTKIPRQYMPAAIKCNGVEYQIL